MVLRLIGGVLLAAVIVVLTLYLRDPAYWQRFAGLATGKNTGAWYSPTELVVGNETAPLPVAAPEERTVSEEALAAARDYAAGMNSYSLIVWHQGKVQTSAYYQDRTRESEIVAKSMAKMLANIAMGRAIALGYIEGLDQPASDVITEWKGDERERITVRNIMHMATGHDYYYKITVNPFSMFHRAFLSSRFEDVIVDKLPMRNEPGEVYDYSQPVSDLVAILIERSSGRRYAEFLSEEVFKPIGAKGGPVWISRPNGQARSGCCIMLPSEDWIRLAKLLLHDGAWEGEQLLPDWWLEATVEPSPSNPHYGLYLWLGKPYQERRHIADPARFDNPLPGTYHSEPYLADDLFLIDGNGSQVLYIVPSEDLMILRTGGWPGAGGGGETWDNAYLPNTIIRGLKEDEAAPEPASQPASEPASEQEPL